MEDYNPFALLKETPMLDRVIDHMYAIDKLRSSIDWEHVINSTPEHGIPIGLGMEKDGSPWMHFITRSHSGSWNPLKILYEKPLEIPNKLEWKDCFLLIPAFEKPYGEMQSKKFFKDMF